MRRLELIATNNTLTAGPDRGPILTRRSMAVWPRWREADPRGRQDLERGLHPDETAGFQRLAENLRACGDGDWFEWRGNTLQLRTGMLDQLLAGLRMQPTALADFIRFSGLDNHVRRNALEAAVREHYAAAWEQGPPPAPTGSAAHPNFHAMRADARVQAWLQHRGLPPLQAFGLLSTLAAELNLTRQNVERILDTLTAAGWQPEGTTPAGVPDETTSPEPKENPMPTQAIDKPAVDEPAAPTKLELTRRALIARGINWNEDSVPEQVKAEIAAEVGSTPGGVGYNISSLRGRNAPFPLSLAAAAAAGEVTSLAEGTARLQVDIDAIPSPAKEAAPAQAETETPSWEEMARLAFQERDAARDEAVEWKGRFESADELRATYSADNQTAFQALGEAGVPLCGNLMDRVRWLVDAHQTLQALHQGALGDREAWFEEQVQPLRRIEDEAKDARAVLDAMGIPASHDGEILLLADRITLLKEHLDPSVAQAVPVRVEPSPETPVFVGYARLQPRVPLARERYLRRLQLAASVPEGIDPDEYAADLTAAADAIGAAGR